MDWVVSFVKFSFYLCLGPSLIRKYLEWRQAINLEHVRDSTFATALFYVHINRANAILISFRQSLFTCTLHVKTIRNRGTKTRAVRTAIPNYSSHKFAWKMCGRKSIIPDKKKENLLKLRNSPAFTNIQTAKLCLCKQPRLRLPYEHTKTVLCTSYTYMYA